VRREWLTAFLTRKTAPKGTTVFIAASLAHCPHALTQALTGSHRLAGVLLRCPDSGSGYGRGAAGVLGLLEGASERRAEVVTLALVLAAYEDSTGKHSWRHVDPATARYLQFLTDAGYTPSAVERLASSEPLPAAGDAGTHQATRRKRSRRSARRPPVSQPLQPSAGQHTLRAGRPRVPRAEPACGRRWPTPRATPDCAWPPLPPPAVPRRTP